jgi:hypothetical protein
MGVLALRPADLQEFDGEARVRDVRLGEVLGMAQPLNIRQVIEKNAEELASHGSIHAARELIEHGKGGRREITAYHLSEPQALLICMFSRAPNAAAARAQIIKVYMAYRHGQLVSADRNDPWVRMERRIEQLEELIRGQRVFLSPEYAEAVAYAPSVLRLTKPDGSPVKRQRRPNFWPDLEVRQALIARHRQMTIDQALEEIADEFGEERVPSRSAVGRFWCQLDEIRAVN